VSAASSRHASSRRACARFWGLIGTEAGSKVSEEIERRKRALVVDVANEVWGEG